MPHHAALGEHWREIVERQHRMHVRERERCRLVDAANRSVGVWAAHEGGVEQARHHHIVDVAALAAQERLVLDARDARADQHARPPHSFRNCCRPREGGDPYAVCSRCCTNAATSKVRWLWVPACAGTTPERCEPLISTLPGRLSPAPPSGWH